MQNVRNTVVSGAKLMYQETMKGKLLAMKDQLAGKGAMLFVVPPHTSNED